MSGVIRFPWRPRSTAGDRIEHGAATNPLGRLIPQRRAHEMAQYHTASIHEGVPIKELILALAAGGLGCSNVPGRGLVIHMQHHDPELPAPAEDLLPGTS